MIHMLAVGRGRTVGSAVLSPRRRSWTEYAEAVEVLEVLGQGGVCLAMDTGFQAAKCGFAVDARVAAAAEAGAPDSGSKQSA